MAATLVLGASGKVGGALLDELVRRGMRPRAATRNAHALAAARNGEVETVAFDLDRPETWGQALNGIGRVFLIAKPGDEQADRYGLPLIDEMKRRGVRRVVALTAMGVEAMEESALRRIERHLEASGLEFTHVRPNWFMQIFSTDPLLTAIRSQAAIHVPAAAARLSFIHVHDVAAVAAAALTDRGHDGKAYRLTGGEALNHEDVAREISAASGRHITYASIDEDAARTMLTVAGFPASRIERLIGFYRLVRAGFCSPVSTDVETVLGRAPIPFTQFAAEHARLWV
jgi:uncharacterized protein YbjT (DUF2867 family)